jgi:hypothetical protein
MKLTILSLFVVFMFLASSVNAIDYSVGVSPPVVEAGKIEGGTTKIIKFYINTISDETLLVRLEPQESSFDFFVRDAYKTLKENYSEQSVKGWAEFLSNPVELKPNNETVAPGYVRGRREINFLLNVPENADPGYHILNIMPTPKVLDENFGAVGSGVVALTSVNVLFFVPGEAHRDGIILDVLPEAFSNFGQIIGINTHFQNTGTLSIIARSVNRIYSNNTLVAEIMSGKEIVMPGEKLALKAPLSTSGLSEGDYRIETVVDYTTGTASKNTTMSLHPTQTVTVSKTEFPFWIIILVIIVILIILYYKIDRK